MKKTLSTAVLALAVASPALAETWTMTSTWPSSLELIEIDRKWVENVGKMVDPDVLTIEFYDGGALVPAGEVFGAVESGTIQAGADWPGYWAGRNPAFSPLATTASLFNAVDYVNWIQEWGGADLYNEIYGQFGMVYLPYGVTNNESGFRTVSQPIQTLEDLQGLRLRLSGLEQGRLLEKLGGSQVSMAGGEIYQSLERGVIDGAEFSTPNVDFSGGFQQVTQYWSTPGWHQSSSVFGVMINKASWDALDEGTQERLKLAADATMLWSLSFTERRANEAYRQFEEAGTQINRLDDAALERIQELANETIVEVACENADSARVYASMIGYLEDYSTWRTASAPFDLGRTPNGPDLAAIEACAQ